MRVVHDFASDCGNCRDVIFKIENHQDLYLRSTMSQERLDGLTITSIEHECAKDTDFDQEPDFQNFLRKS